LLLDDCPEVLDGKVWQEKISQINSVVAAMSTPYSKQDSISILEEQK